MIKDLSLTRTDFGQVTYGPGGTCGPRRQPVFQLVLVHHGEACVIVDGEPHEIPAGYARMQSPARQEYFAFSTVRKTHHSWCCFLFDGNDKLWARLEQTPRVVPLSERLTSLVMLGDSLGTAEDELARSMRRHLGCCVIVEYLMLQEGGLRRQGPLPDAVSRALELIDQEYGRHLTLGDLAAAAFVSGPHLIRLFKKHMGMTPMAYLWDVRAKRAAQLIRETGLCMSAVADRTGFKSTAHLSRVTKNHYGVPPRELRSSESAGFLGE